MSHILIAEDEPAISSFLQKGLSKAGYVTTVAHDGHSTLMLARHSGVDLLILDLGLPGRDGLSVLRELRRTDPHLPVIILTARDGLEDTVAGLDGGADDYIPKPFRFAELLARVRARLRPQRGRSTVLLRAGDAELDLRTRTIRSGGREEELTAREFALAETFFRHPGQVLSREQLLSDAWGYHHDPGSNIVEVYVGYLRRKLDPGRISTARGMGYRLETFSGDSNPS
ncbi:MAG: response regulator transcription factor [Nitriliruptorales bacterium]